MAFKSVNRKQNGSQTRLDEYSNRRPFPHVSPRKKRGYLGEGIGETVVIGYDKSLTYFHRSNFFFILLVYKQVTKLLKLDGLILVLLTLAKVVSDTKYSVNVILWNIQSRRTDKLEVRDQRAQIKCQPGFFSGLWLFFFRYCSFLFGLLSKFCDLLSSNLEVFCPMRLYFESALEFYVSFFSIFYKRLSITTFVQYHSILRFKCATI